MNNTELFNLGSLNSNQSRVMATVAVGLRSRISDQLDMGFADESLLASSDESVMKDRITPDVVWSFRLEASVGVFQCPRSMRLWALSARC